MPKRYPITVIPGDGIGPEIMAVTLAVLEAIEAPLDWEHHSAGKQEFLSGNPLGISSGVFDSVKHSKVILKGPLETPIGYGEKSANVSLRKYLDTFANIRPAFSLPMIRTPFSDRRIELVLVRENLEDTYMGVEYMQNETVAESLKHISKHGCDRVLDVAFKYAEATRRSTVHCVTKANILKRTEGLLKSRFEALASDFPKLTPKHMLVDNCAHQLVKNPEQFELIVCSNLHGDILSDLCSGLVGGLGVASSANIGNPYSIFEAVHGSAPDIAGKGLANPISLLLSAGMMLEYLGLDTYSEVLKNALFATLEDGIATKDLLGDKGCSTETFQEALIGNIGKKSRFKAPQTLMPLTFSSPDTDSHTSSLVCEGIDVFFTLTRSLDALLADLQPMLTQLGVNIELIANNGAKLYPKPPLEIAPHSLMQLRVKSVDSSLTKERIAEVLSALSVMIEWSHLQKLWRHPQKGALYSEL